MKLVGEFFECLDLDDNGAIDEREAKAKLKEDAHYLFEDCEVDQDGTITRARFFEGFDRYKNRIALQKEREEGKGKTEANTDNPELIGALKRSIEMAREFNRSTRMLLEEAMVGTVRLEDDEEDDMDERKDSQPPKYWPMQKPVHDKKPYLS
uniref:EF-hand domain-containing protein n=2 Tax=Lotharella globosa TaxID=91324 RepID=A0A7S4DJV4_9EUKA